MCLLWYRCTCKSSSVAEMSVGQTFVMIPCKTLSLVERDPNRTELCERHLVVKALTVTTKII